MPDAKRAFGHDGILCKDEARSAATAFAQSSINPTANASPLR